MDLDVCRKAVQNYEATYKGMYNHQPSERCVEAFCRLHNIPWPIPEDEEVIPDPYELV